MNTPKNIDKKRIYTLIFIILGAAISFIPFLGSVHLFDWDEANFAELAREMIVSGNYLQPQINFHPFYEKPPLFIWLQVISMKIFGINEFAARFPNAIAGIIVLLSLYAIGKKHYSHKIGILWALSFGTSIAPHFYFKTGLIDPIFNFFIFLSIYFFTFLFIEPSSKWKYSIFSGIFAGLAVMTKGPVALIIIIGSLGLGWLILKLKSWKNIGWTIPWTLTMLVLSSIWFIYITQNYGYTYVDEFIKYQIRLFETEDAKHGGTIFYHPIVLLIGCFPASIYMWTAFKKQVKFQNEFQEVFFKLMIACGVIVLIVFTLVKTKIIHYSSMDYYPICFFAALGLGLLLDKQAKLNKIQLTLLMLIGLIWTIALTVTPYLGINIEKVKPYIQDKNFLAQLQTPIEWNIWACILGVVFGIIYFYGILNMILGKFRKGIISISTACLFCIATISQYYLPRIEQLVQGSLVEFCKNIRNEDANHVAAYMKSYNIFYYTERQPFINKEDTLKHLYYYYHNIERNVYIFARNQDSLKIANGILPNTSVVYNQNGLTVFLRRKK